MVVLNTVTVTNNREVFQEARRVHSQQPSSLHRNKILHPRLHENQHAKQNPVELAWHHKMREYGEFIPTTAVFNSLELDNGEYFTIEIDETTHTPIFWTKCRL